MFKKSMIAAAAIVAILPVSGAFANDGKDMLAATLGLVPNQFTLSELGQIEGEHGAGNRASRAAYILASKANVHAVVAEAHSTPYFGLNAQQRVGRD